MLHAPTSENKRQNPTSRTALSPGRTPGLSPPVPATTLPGWSGAAPHHQVMRLHSRYGNQAVLRILSHSTPAIQAKLAVNQPGDQYEQEADRVADQIMRMAAPVTVQRKCSACAEEEKLQRKCAECEEEEKKTELHRKEADAGPQFAPPSVHQVLNSPGHPLDPATRAFMEPRFGFDFSQVRIHDDQRAADSAQAVGALAYTVGRDLVFGPGRHQPNHLLGQRLLAHELAHVVQQSSIEPPTLMWQDAEPVSGASPSPCEADCGRKFEECKGKRDPNQCMADLSFCLHSCDEKEASKKKPEEPSTPAAPAPQTPKPKTQAYPLSDAGRDFIALPPNEGFCPTIYDDATPNCGRGKGNCTIGIGRLIHNGICTEDDEKKYPPVTKQAEAELFKKKLGPYIKMVNDNVKVELTQCQFDALVSFAYNAGALHELLPVINDGKYDEMPELIKKTRLNGGVLTLRRNREADLFANCNYKPTK